MVKWISILFAKLYVALYVTAGYVKYFFTNLHILKNRKIFAIALSVLFIMAGLSFYLLSPIQNKTGNDALDAAYDYTNKGQIAEAQTQFQNAYDIFEKDNYLRGMFVASRALADLEMVEDDLAGALPLYDQTLALAKRLGYKQVQINLFIQLGKIKKRLNRANAARAHFYDGLKIAQDIKSNPHISTLYTYIGNLERDIGNERRARFAYRDALEIYKLTNDRNGEANLHWNIGYMEGTLDNYDAALASYIQARDMFKLSSNILNEANVVKFMARLEKKRGQNEKASNYYNEAATLYSSIGNVDDVTRLREEAGQLL